MNAVVTQASAPARERAPTRPLLPVVIVPEPSPEQELLLQLIQVTRKGRRTGGEVWNGFSGCTTGHMALLL